MQCIKSLLCVLIACVAILVGGQSVMAQDVSKLTLQVLEKGTDAPIPGAIVKREGKVYVTDVQGTCSIPLKRGERLVLSIHFIGYEDIVSRRFDYKSNTPLIIRMKPSTELLEGVSVETERRHTTQLQQVEVVNQKVLERSPALSLAKMLETLPGVSSISTGSTIAKPVIQGMHSSRILLMNNGVRLESQSWGEDHAPEIDHTAASVVEVIKGAEAIRYGYGAMGGVVLVNQAPLPYGSPKFLVKGFANLGYSTNGKAPDISTSVEAGYKNWGARLHGMYQKGGDYSTAQYILNNTGYNNISLSGTLGYRSGSVTASIFSSLYYSRSGLYYASKISDVDQLMARFLAGRPEPESFYPFSYKIEPPFQQTQHFTLKGDVMWDINQDHSIEFKLTYQDNLRQEFENRKQPKISWLPMQDLQLTTYSTEAIWNGRWHKMGMSTQVGLSAVYQYNYNIPGTKQPAFIPNFAAATTGIFAVHKARIGDLQCSAGMRYDFRVMDVKGYTSLSSFKYYDDFKLYSNFTGNLAAHYDFSEHLDMRANVGWAWRPPDINELYSTGLHHGTYWVVGNPNLLSERGYKAIIGGRYRDTWYSIEPSAFFQYIKGYIYDSIGEGANRFHNHPSGKYPQFIFAQDDARFFGGDITATVIPTKGLTLTGKGEWISARNLTQQTWLPFMPSDRYGLSADYALDFGKNDFWHSSFSLNGTYVTKQKRFDPDKDLVPDSPPAYFLLNASAEVGCTLSNGLKLKVMLVGDNVLNTLYKEYTDRFRYYAHARGAQFTLRTVINI